MLQGDHSAILLTFIELPFVIEIFVLSIFEWPLKTGFTVLFSIALTSVTLTQVPAGTLSLALYTPDKQTELTSAALGATAVIKATFSRTGIIWASMGRSRGGGAGGPDPPPPEKNTKI